MPWLNWLTILNIITGASGIATNAKNESISRTRGNRVEMAGLFSGRMFHAGLVGVGGLGPTEVQRGPGFQPLPVPGRDLEVDAVANGREDQRGGEPVDVRDARANALKRYDRGLDL